MLVELKSKSQITIPKSIVDSLGLEIGDTFEIIEENGQMRLFPVAIYPESTVEELKKSVDEIKKSVERGEQPVFDNIDELFEELEKKEK